jgi:hypothetical protein
MLALSFSGFDPQRKSAIPNLLVPAGLDGFQVATFDSYTTAVR